MKHIKAAPHQAFGDRLVYAMKQSGVSGRALAEAVGVTPPTVSEWRGGRQPPEDSRVEKIAAVLQVSPQWLRYGDPNALGLPNPLSESVADASWRLTLSTMRAQAEMVATLAAEVQKQQAPVVQFLRMMENGAGLGISETTRSSERQTAIDAVAHAREAEQRGADEQAQKGAPDRARKRA